MESGERPLFYGKIGVGDIVKRTFNIFKSNFSRFLLPFLILYGVMAIIFSLIYHGFFDLSYDDLLKLQEKDLDLVISVIIVTILVFIIFLFIAIGMVIQMVADAHEGKEVDLGKSFKVASSKMFSLIGAAILVGILTLIGLFLFIIPGILFFVWFSLSAQAVILEDKSAKDSLSRSKELVKGNWWKTFGVIIVIGIFLFIINIIGNFISDYLYDQIREDYSESIAITIFLVFSYVFLAFLSPLYAIALTLLFIDLRIKQTLTLKVTPQVVRKPSVFPKRAGLCQQCSIQLPIEADYCPNCGTKIRKEEEKRPEEKTCQFCGTSVPVEASFCIQCGRKLPKIEEGKFCTQCGIKNPIGALYCANCGSRLKE